MAIRLDVSNFIARAAGTGPGGGIAAAEFEGAAARFGQAHAALRAQHAAGILGFLDLPANAALLRQVTDFADARGSRYRDVVVLGIGGSALGPIAMRTALRAPGWNALPDGSRDGWPRLHVLDNVDPRTIAALLDTLDLRQALFIVTSKSGGTAETMSQFLVVHEQLARVHGSRMTDHLAFVTDPEKGALRAIARREGIPAFDVPSNVGGRFSVLSPVGTLPAALVGIDVAQLLAGAGDMALRCAGGELRTNPAGVFAVLQWLADTRHGLKVQVLMPYRDALRDMAAWFVQLWAESLGKRRPDGTHVGPTPLPALGATDQHSQVQLFMEGPPDKTVVFLAAGRGEGDVTIPRAYGDIAELAYLGGHTLGELLDAERCATAGALARAGRPNATITLDAIDPWHVGALMMLFEIATIYAGDLYGVNPLDQPGVELGKQFTFAMLGRPGSDAARREWDRMPAPDPRWQL
ncbi:MAG: glucose-6-phosphate isomerase [Gemmatimonadetes bacterium]|nr:glucose-6-phosphate isomerase [Gemmatimonadota bacterium]